VLVGAGSVAVVALLVSLALAALFLWLPRRHAPWLPVLVAAGFLVTWLPLQLWHYSFREASVGAWFQGIGPGKHRDWIDRAVGRDANVAAIWSGGPRGNPFTVWENEFFNRSVRRVYDLGASLPGAMPEQHVGVEEATGVLHARGRPLDARYVLTDASVDVVGDVVARDPVRGIELVRAAQPVRLTTRIVGRYPADTWSGPKLSWIRSDCAGGTLAVRLRTDLSLFPAGQRILVDGTLAPRTVRLTKRVPQRTVVLPLSSEGGVCRAVFTVSPSRVPGNGDTRLLGTHFDAFAFKARR
jgi:hypothetical protein